MNQCDGCKLGLPIENSIHIHPNKTGWERLHMCCTKRQYEVKRPQNENGNAIHENKIGVNKQ